MNLSDFQCTCGAEGEWHLDDCNLQDCGSFTLGMVRWNGESLERDPSFDPELLRPPVQRDRRYQEPFTTETWLPYGMLVRVDEAVESWTRHHPDDPWPMNFSAYGVTWVWDEVHAHWYAQQLGCYCGESSIGEDGFEDCDRCQVIRKVGNDYWLQGHIDRDEATCRCVPPTKYSCQRCEVRRLREDEPWEPIVKHSSYIGKQVQGPPPCSHRLDGVELGDGTIVYGSQWHHREPEDDHPDWGVYLDSNWANGDMIGTLLPWKDFGLPRVPIRAVHKLAVDIHRRAQTESIEVACMGGHGRTGTFLAILGVVSGLSAKEAVAHVREKYCHKAVEMRLQEWYVEAMHAVHHDIPFLTPMPQDEWSKKDPVKEVKQETLLGQTRRCADCLTSPLKDADTVCDLCGGPII